MRKLRNELEGFAKSPGLYRKTVFWSTKRFKRKGMSEDRLEELRSVYKTRRDVIERRLQEFREKGKRPAKELFSELVFCLLTPMSRAKVCWTAVEELERSGVLYNGDREQILEKIAAVRFAERKAEYIVEVRKMFLDPGRYDLVKMIQEAGRPETLREWLVKNVKGLGHKEASHFLRNVGVGLDLAILDRHILKNLEKYGVIDIPSCMTRNRYFEIENRMKGFANDIGIGMGALDLLLWSMETGEVFK